MNSWTRVLLGELRARADGPVSESGSLFDVDVHLLDAESWAWLCRARDEAAERDLTLMLVDRNDGDGIDLLNEEFSPELAHRGRVRIVKAAIPKTLRFLTREGLEAALRQEPERFEAARIVLAAEIDEAYGTVGILFHPWEDAPPEPPQVLTSASPRRLTVDITGSGLVPSNATTWLAEDVGDTWYIETIIRVGSRRLALCMANEIVRDADNNIQAVLRGGRKVAAMLPEEADDRWGEEPLFSALNDAGAWIFCEGKEAESKHALLTAELARSWPANADWISGLRESLQGALEAARTAYRLHIHEKGVDALKLMSDLRNGLAADVRAVAAQTATLSAGLWRDAAIAFGATALRVVMGGASFWLPIVAAVYLAVSCYLNWRVTSGAVNAIAQNEKTFRERLYRPLLLEREYNELAGSRYTAVIREFRRYRWYVVATYVAAIVALLIVGFGLGDLGIESGLGPPATNGDGAQGS